MNTKTIEDFADIMSRYDPSKNKTKNMLTKYEKVKIIGVRIEQLQRGAQPNIYVDMSKPFDPKEIAHEELRQNKLPMMVCRRLPDGEKEYWRLNDMIIL